MTTRTDSRNTSPSDPPRRTYDRDTIDRLKRTTGIAPFRTRLKQWRKNGKEYKAICPFHDDHNPSLSVYRDKVSGQSRFKCFSCGKSGDTLDLVQHIDHVDLQTAIQKLASEVGFDLPASDSAEPVLPAFSYDWREGTERLLQDESALRYLSSRGIVDKRLISENKIGLCEAARLGLSLVFPYEIDESSGKVTAKLRALGDNVPDGKKFSHFTGTKTATLLFNEKALDSFIYGNESIFVTESELDCLMMEQQGYRAVSVSSASACAKKVNDIEQITIEPHFIEQLRDAHSIFILTDMDDAGNKCAGLLMEAIGRPSKTFRIRWDYGGKGSGQPKDIGDLARQLGGDSDKFRSKIESLCEEAKVPILWRQAPTLGEIPHREPSWLVPDLAGC